MATTIDQAVASVQDMGASEYKRAWDSQQGTVDSLAAQLATETNLNAVLNGEIAADEAQIAALQAQVDALTPATVNELHDFGVDNVGQPGVALWVKSGAFGKIGDRKKTIYRLSSTSKVSETTPGKTTPWFVMMCGGGSSNAIATDLDVKGFTLDCTPLTNLTHHGLRFGYSKNGKLTNVVVKGARGTASSPPGETFSHPSWHSDNEQITDVVLDGRDANGVPVGASGWGLTSCVGGHAVRLTSNYMAAGFGITWFNCSGDFLVEDSDLRFNRKAVNIEASLGGSVTFRGVDFRGTTGASFITQCSSKGIGISTVVRYEDCIFDGDLCQVLTYGQAANGGLNNQKDSDITRWETVNGVLVKVTDTSRFQIIR